RASPDDPQHAVPARSVYSPTDRAPPLYVLSLLTAPSPTEISTLSLHDALPIFGAFRSCIPDRRCRKPRDVLGRTPVVHFHRKKRDRKSTRLNSSHVKISYAVFCLKKKKEAHQVPQEMDCTPKLDSCERTKAR